MRTANPALLDWLEEFSAPWLSASRPDSHSDCDVVELDVHAPGFRDFVAKTEPTGARAACFTLDDPGADLALVRAADGVEYALDEAFGTAVGARPSGGGRRHVRVLAEYERPAARLVAMRVLRELASAHALAAGGVLLHASAVEGAGGVTIFAGARLAGKSTLLLSALAGGETRFVANDRVFLEIGAGRPAARGVPTIVSLREGSLSCMRALDVLGRELLSGAWHYASSVAEARRNRALGRPAAGSGHRRPPGISPAQLCTLLAAEPSCGGGIARVVLPEVRSAGQRFALHRLSPEEAASRLLRTGLVADGRPATFVSGIAPPARDASIAGVEALVKRVPCFACALGPGAYEAPSAWEAIRQLPAA